MGLIGDIPVIPPNHSNHGSVAERCDSMIWQYGARLVLFLRSLRSLWLLQSWVSRKNILLSWLLNIAPSKLDHLDLHLTYSIWNVLILREKKFWPSQKWMISLQFCYWYVWRRFPKLQLCILYIFGMLDLLRGVPSSGEN